MQIGLLKQLNAEWAARRACVLVTNTANGAQRLVLASMVAADPMAEILEKQVRIGKSAAVQHAGEDFFLTVQTPPVRLILIGAVHISQALAPMAQIAELDVTIIDPRTAFATPERFVGVSILPEWPDVALARLGLDQYTALALLTHDPKIDDPALVAALKAQCFYIGALGSRKTHGARVARMTAAGFLQADTARIHAPIGLDIGAVSPAEIAASILAEIIAALRKKPLRAEVAA